MRFIIIQEKKMEIPYNMRSTIFPEEGNKIDYFDKHSKYLIKITKPEELSKTLFNYAESYFKAAQLVKKYVLNLKHPDIGKLDTYIFFIAFLYRHSIELGLKAIGFSYISDLEDRKNFIKSTRHDLQKILCFVKEMNNPINLENEIMWLENYFGDLSIYDRESDSFRYPFHIWKEKGVTKENSKLVIKAVFEEQTHIDLIKFANKFEASFEILKKWYDNDTNKPVEWSNLNPIFLETGGSYYQQAVVGYTYFKYKYEPYVKAYLEVANYLKFYMKKKIDDENTNFENDLFLPMCYLYRNCTELSLKAIWYEDLLED